MVLSGMELLYDARHARLVESGNDKKVFAVKAHLQVIHNDFNMGEALDTGANLILTLHDEHPFVLEHPHGFFCRLNIKL
jgi:hypothetical protein